MGDLQGLGAADCQKVKFCEAANADQAAADEEAADGDGELPDGWEKHWSSENDAWYYWHAPTKESSWIRPKLAKDVTDDDYPLPDGWEKHFDADHAEWYYWHKPSRTSQWQHPGKPPDSASGTEGTQRTREAELAVQHSAKGPVLGQQRLQGQITKWHKFFGWITPLQPLSQDLQTLFERHQEEIYVNWRDVQTGVILEAGVCVDFLVYADDHGLGAFDVGLLKEGNESAQQPMEQDECDIAQAVYGESGRAGTTEAKAEMDSHDDSEGLLLPGWEQQWSDEHQCHYYWHKASKQSSWERPAVLVNEDEKQVLLSKDNDKIKEGESAPKSTTRTATPLTPLVSTAGKEMTPITPTGPKLREPVMPAPPPALPAAGKRPLPVAGGRGTGKGAVGKGGVGQDNALTPAGRRILAYNEMKQSNPGGASHVESVGADATFMQPSAKQLAGPNRGGAWPNKLTGAVRPPAVRQPFVSANRSVTPPSSATLASRSYMPKQNQPSNFASEEQTTSKRQRQH